MDTVPPGPTNTALDESEQQYCYGHPNTPTKLRCSRCDRPICGRCAIPASVGQHCPECVAEARRSTRRVRTVRTNEAPVTFTLLGILIVIFVIQQLVPHTAGFDELSIRYGLDPRAIALGHEWYRLLTPMLLHANILHIAFNGYALFIIGPFVERAFGSRTYIALFVVTGFAGSVASYAFGPCNELGVGASGAIFGLIGVLLVYVYKRRDNEFMRRLFNNIVVIVVLNAVIGIGLSSVIDIRAHAGGFVAGVVLGAGLDNRWATTSPAASKVVMYTGVILACLLLIAERTAGFAC
jgi:membrane associated rhomboid family serine protease